jgi:hypothetical protein
MGATENIIAAVLILVVLIAGGIAYAGTAVKWNIKTDEDMGTFLEEQKLSSSFDTALLLTEPESGRQWGDLLASAAYYHSESYNLTGRTINITERFRSTIADVLDSERFYFEVFPEVKSIELIFIGPGEDRMLPVYAVLERDFDDMMRDLNGTFKDKNITGRLIVMEGRFVCSDIQIDCSYLTADQVYNNNMSSEFELIKYENGLFRPTGDASVANDWETASSFYMVMHRDMPMTRSVFIFPIADSLPASTQTNPCYQAYANSVLGRDNGLMRRYNFNVNPIVVDNGDPKFCQQAMSDHAKSLVESTLGQATRFNQNFLGDITKTVQHDLDTMTLRGGNYGTGPQVVMERSLQMPDGTLTKVRLHVFT